MNSGPQDVLALATVEAWLCEHLAKRLDISASEIDIQRDFSSFGLASVEALNLVRDLEDWVGLKLTPTLAWDYPTVAALARHIVQATAARPDITNEFSNAPNQPTNNSEPIAIVGIGCRYPGAENVQALWKLLCQGEDAITALQDDRWDPERYYHPDPSAPGKMGTRLGGFLPKLDEFDAQFFGISPREAPHVDPRQRLMLEVTWEALEDAGIPPYALAGTNTGVYVAILSNDYDQLLSRNLNRIDAYTGPGTANSILANRISYWLDLHGVSIAIDTACSGSLVAVHLACQGLHRGEFSMALVGGVNLNLLPKSNVFFTKAGALSSNGRCKTFDDEADGIVRSDGAGMIVLKPLAQAQADGDPIYAAICGSALNHDGRSNGIMAPNGQAQQQMLREAYRQAGITPDQVQYIEAHGTGTRLGDPIEVTALGAILATNRQPDHPCVLGSIKTNIGHTEAAAGIASLIKAALAIRYRMIPPNLHYQKPNVLIPFDELPFTVYQELSPWPSPDQPLIAGVSGFGFGGTNAHVVLQEGPQPVQSLSVSETDQPYLVPLSAHTPEALHQLAQAYRETLLNEQTRPALPDMAYTAAVRRSHHPQRLALVARSNEDVVESLSAFLDGEEHPRIINGTTPANDGGKLAFVFSGQGSHWIKMGLNLFASEPIFRQTLTQCDELLRWYVKWSLLDELTAPESASRLHETDVTQPAIFAIQAALADLWAFWGIVPDMIVGHSLGEVAATYAAGVLTLEDAIHIVFHRSRLMKQVAGRGKTAVVGLSMAEAQGVLAGFEARLAVAGSNSPTTSVLAGDPETLHQVLNSLQERKVFCRELKGINIAFHSPQMDPLRNELVEVLNGLMPQPARIPIFSTLTGQTAQGSDFRNDALSCGGEARFVAHLSVAAHPILV